MATKKTNASRTLKKPARAPAKKTGKSPPKKQTELQELKDFLKETVVALKKAKGDKVAVGQVIKEYKAKGRQLEYTPAQLADHFYVSTPSLPERARFTAAQIEEAAKLFDGVSSRSKSTPKKVAPPPLEAAEKGKLDGIRKYLGEGGDINAVGLLKRTLLAEAIANGQKDVANFLLKKGADPNIPDYRKETALHYAATLAWAEMIERLLAAGANPMAEDSGLKLPLHRAAKSQRRGKRGELLGSYDGFPKPEKTRSLELLLKFGFGPDADISADIALDFIDKSGVLDGRDAIESAKRSLIQ